MHISGIEFHKEPHDPFLSAELLQSSRSWQRNNITFDAGQEPHAKILTELLAMNYTSMKFYPRQMFQAPSPFLAGPSRGMPLASTKHKQLTRANNKIRHISDDSIT